MQPQERYDEAFLAGDVEAVEAELSGLIAEDPEVAATHRALRDVDGWFGKAPEMPELLSAHIARRFAQPKRRRWPWVAGGVGFLAAAAAAVLLVVPVERLSQPEETHELAQYWAEPPAAQMAQGMPAGSQTTTPRTADNIDGLFEDHYAKRGKAKSAMSSDRIYEADVPRQRAHENYAVAFAAELTTPAEAPLSTFGIDVDTASYANVRRFLSRGGLPPQNAVRLEELINYFDYSYPPPSNEAVAIHVDATRCPWNDERVLVRVGVKARELERRPPSNLVFLIDVSGSMDEPDKLPLVLEALRLLAGELERRDTVAIVVYAGASGLVLPPTSSRERILDALDRLRAGGSTAGAAGLQLAYDVAASHFVDGGSNRVILATDGDFNVGVTGHEALMKLVEDNATSGVFLTVLGFGTGNLNDAMLEQLADRGNGTYGYIDTLEEARRMFIDQLAGTLVTVAKDVKVQVEPDPRYVARYRLLGYDNRLMAARDFDDDKKDGGEMGAGHAATALYEVEPRGEARAGLLSVKVRYKDPDGDRSRMVQARQDEAPRELASASDDLRFAAAVAMFGMALRGEGDAEELLDQARRLAFSSRGRDPRGLRRELVDMIRQAESAGGEPYQSRMDEGFTAPLTPSDVKDGVSRYGRSVGPCIMQGRHSGELPPGEYTLILDFTIRANGTVANPRMKGPESAMSIRSCVEDAMRSWRFRASPKDVPIAHFPLGPIKVK